MYPKIESLLRKNLPHDQVQKAIDFLNKDFSTTGQAALAAVFWVAHHEGKSVDEVLVALQAEWDRNWNFQHPDLRGNPYAPGAAGVQNNTSLLNVYSALGVLPPQKCG